MMVFYTVFSFLFGACFGSFANVLIYRLPLEKSIAFPASHCPKCQTPLKWYHNIPILGWIFLDGKCAFCKEPISVRYIIVELINASAWALLFLFFGLSINFLVGIILFWSLLIIFLIDLDHQIIPDSMNVLIAVLGLGTAWFRFGGAMGLLQSFLGLVFGFLAFLVVGFLGEKLFKKEALGGGDVKLLGALGTIIGISGVLETIFVSAFLGVIVGGLMLLFKKIDNEERVMPYGPFIALAAFNAYLLNNLGFKIYIDYMELGDQALSFIQRYF